MTATDTLNALIVREPAESELPLCRMLLPEACAQPNGRYFRLVFIGDPGKLVAAISYRDDSTALGGLRIQVIPTHRRMGIASRLVDCVAEEARRVGRGRVLADVDLHTEPEAEQFLISRGFRKLATITFAEIGIQDLRAYMQARREAKRSEAEQLPASARYVSLSEAPVAEVTKLYAEHIRHAQVMAGMRESIRMEQANESIALLVNDRLVGFVLARLESGILRIPAWVVIPEFRGHRIGQTLLYQLAARLRGQVERFQFEFTDAAMITPRMLSVPGCEITKIAARFEQVVA